MTNGVYPCGAKYSDNQNGENTRPYPQCCTLWWSKICYRELVEKKMTVLDVGCGLHPRGDVNVDLYITSEHRRTGKGPLIDVENTPNFIQADALDMYMFKDRQFEVVRCYHLMEHIREWWILLRELWRVTKHHLVVEVPSRYWLRPLRLKRPYQHVSNFDSQTLEKAIPIVLKTRNFEITTKYRGMFHKMIPFPYWPHHIRVDIWRDN